MTLAKWMQETGAPWMDVLPLVLMEGQNDPQVTWVSPYEILFGRPPPVIWEVKGNLLQKGRMEMSQHLEQLGKEIHDTTPYVQERIPFSLGTNVHPYSPGDSVRVKAWKQRTLSCSA